MFVNRFKKIFVFKPIGIILFFILLIFLVVFFTYRYYIYAAKNTKYLNSLLKEKTEVLDKATRLNQKINQAILYWEAENQKLKDEPFKIIRKNSDEEYYDINTHKIIKKINNLLGNLKEIQIFDPLTGVQIKKIVYSPSAKKILMRTQFNSDTGKQEEIYYNEGDSILPSDDIIIPQFL